MKTRAGPTATVPARIRSRREPSTKCHSRRRSEQALGASSGFADMEQSVPREPSTQQRFDRRMFVALAGGGVGAAIEAKGGGGFPLPRAASAALDFAARQLSV